MIKRNDSRHKNHLCLVGKDIVFMRAIRLMKSSTKRKSVISVP